MSDHSSGVQHSYELVGPFYDDWVLLDAWQVSAEDLLDRTKRIDVLACPDVDGTLLYPTFQFTPELQVRADVIAVAQLLCQTEAERWWTAAWLRTPHAELEYMSPHAWLDAGQDPAVLHRLADITSRSVLHR